MERNLAKSYMGIQQQLNLMLFMEEFDINIVIFILIVIGCILCHTMSDTYNKHITAKYHRKCINRTISCVIAVLLTATLLTIGETSFGVFLALTVTSAILGAWLTYRKMIVWRATGKEALQGSIAQVISAVGIAATIIIFLFLVSGRSDKKRRRR